MIKLSECDVRKNIHKPYDCIKAYPGDESGNITYKFNSLGFRGEEYKPEANKHVFVFGCSYTFGTGLEYDCTWAHNLKKLISERENCDPDKINVLNFGVGTQSNDYITRMLLDQCGKIKPDLVFVLFTHLSRTEYIAEGSNDYIQIDDVGKKEYADDYYSYYTDEIGFVNYVKNILLAQYFCKHNNIDYIFSGIEYGVFEDNKYRKNEVCKFLYNLIDKKNFADIKFEKIDFAANKGFNGPGSGHPGPESNKIYSEKLFKYYISLYK